MEMNMDMSMDMDMEEIKSRMDVPVYGTPLLGKLDWKMS